VGAPVRALPGFGRVGFDEGRGCTNRSVAAEGSGRGACDAGSPIVCLAGVGRASAARAEVKHRATKTDGDGVSKGIPVTADLERSRPRNHRAHRFPSGPLAISQNRPDKLSPSGEQPKHTPPTEETHKNNPYGRREANGLCPIRFRVGLALSIQFQTSSTVLRKRPLGFKCPITAHAVDKRPGPFLVSRDAGSTSRPLAGPSSTSGRTSGGIKKWVQSICANKGLAAGRRSGRTMLFSRRDRYQAHDASWRRFRVSGPVGPGRKRHGNTRAMTSRTLLSVPRPFDRWHNVHTNRLQLEP